MAAPLSLVVLGRWQNKSKHECEHRESILVYPIESGVTCSSSAFVPLSDSLSLLPRWSLEARRGCVRGPGVQ